MKVVGNYMSDENWNLVLEEKFSDLENWNYDIGSGIKGLWGNNEKEFYTNRSNNSYVKDNKLYIVSCKEKYEDCNYTSARLVTRDKIHFKYGYIEIRAKLPSGNGSWPAIWMLGVNDEWPIGGEIDIMEHLGRSENKIYHTIHSKNHICKPYNSFFEDINNACTEFHNYGLHWEEDLIEFYVDRNLTGKIIRNKDYNSKEDWPFNNFFYLIINCAVGGDWPGEIEDSTLPYKFIIEYVKVWQKSDHKIEYIKR